MSQESKKPKLVEKKIKVGEKWIDKKGNVWVVDGVTDHFLMLQSEIEDRIQLKMVDIYHYNDYLNYKLC